MISTTQLGIGISVALSVVPYLKPFISAYELPTPSSSAYAHRFRQGGDGSGSGSGWAFKLSALTSRTSKTGTTASQSQILARSSEENGEEDNSTPHLIPIRHPTDASTKLPRSRSRDGKPRGQPTVLKPPFMIGRLRPEKTKYSAGATATATGKKRNKEEEGSEDSAGLIIKKGVDFSVRSEVEGDGDERTVGEGSVRERGGLGDGEELAGR